MKNTGTKRRIFMQRLLGAGAITGLLHRNTVSRAQTPGADLPVCQTCGTQFPRVGHHPGSCPICEDERQYIGLEGQQWTTLSSIQKQHENVVSKWEDGVYSIHTSPKFGIGQRAFLVQTTEGNLLWDCVTLLDEATRKRIDELGGVDAIAISHPHYYSSMVEWSCEFNGAPIYLHQNDAEWVMRKDESIRFWSGDSLKLFGQITLINTGGHFDGFQVLNKPGLLFVGDQPQVCMDRKWVSFMYSYPNYIPLPKRQVLEITNKLKSLDFDRIYGAFPHQNIQQGAKEMVIRSAQRYIRSIA